MATVCPGALRSVTVRSKVRLYVPTGLMSARRSEDSQNTHTHTQKLSQRSFIYFSWRWYSGRGEKTREKAMDYGRRHQGVGEESVGGWGWGREKEVESVKRNRAELLSDTICLSFCFTLLLRLQTKALMIDVLCLLVIYLSGWIVVCIVALQRCSSEPCGMI